MMVIAKLSERNAQEYNSSTSSQRTLKKLVKMLGMFYSMISNIT